MNQQLRKKIYVGIYDKDNTKENIKIDSYIGKTSYKWRVNGKEIPGNTYELCRGDSASLELIVNNVLIVKTFSVSNADYKFTTKNNTITIDANCRISNFFEVKAVIVSNTTDDCFVPLDKVRGYYESTLCITPILKRSYEFFSYNNNSGIGLNWNGLDIASLNWTIFIPGKNSKTLDSTSCELTALLKSWNYKEPGDISIRVNSILLRGKSANKSVEDNVVNGERGLVVPQVNVNALFFRGKGTTSDPYIISCQRHFDNLRYSCDRNYEIRENLQLTGNWTPIPVFAGNLNGNGCKISGMKIEIAASTTTTNFALFSLNSGTIKNLNLTGASITSEKYHGEPIVNAAGLVGINSGIIENVKMSGKFYCHRYMSAMGGIVANNKAGTIKNCVVNDLELYGNGDIGGIAGVSYGGIIINCHTNNFIGRLYAVKINRCLGGNCWLFGARRNC